MVSWYPILDVWVGDVISRSLNISGKIGAVAQNERTSAYIGGEMEGYTTQDPRK